MSRKNEDMKQNILNYIIEHTEEYGYPPSVREICTKVGLSSPSTVHGYLSRMEREGILKRDSTKNRAIRISREPEAAESKFDKAEIASGSYIEVPVIGDVAAGQPILAQECITDVFPLPSGFTKNNEVFMLKVHGTV